LPHFSKKIASVRGTLKIFPKKTKAKLPWNLSSIKDLRQPAYPGINNAGTHGFAFSQTA